MRKTLACLALFLCLCLPGAAPARAAAQPPATGAPVEIWDRAGLEAMARDPAGHYRLMADIDLGGAPWAPIPFNGTFEGGGHTLYNLTITGADPVPATSVDGNRKAYDTVFAALFSRCSGAVVRDVTLLGAQVTVETGQNAYAAALVGYGEGVTIENCTIDGRVALTMAGRMCGVAGVMGFGYGTITGCTARVELTLVDTNEAENCEEFMGAMLASGYADIENCTAELAAYTSVHGYVHNGGLVGMYYVHTDDTGHPGYVRGNRVEAVINFFEHVASRRAYSAPVIGEQMHWVLEIAGNEVLGFESNESHDYTATLLPEGCAEPAYTETVAAPGCQSFGATTYTCAGCGYSYTGAYTAPAHTPGEWQVAAPATAGVNGRMEQHCALCGALVAEKEIVPAAGCALSDSALRLAPGATARLVATLQPAGVSEAGVGFTSSNEAVATVDQSGLVTAVAPGQATITCTSADGFATADCRLEVAGAFPWGWVAAGAVLVALAAAVATALLLARRRRQRQARRHAYRAVYRRGTRR